MAVRTYYWHSRVVSRPRLLWHGLRGRDRSLYFTTGNAGDIITADIIRLIYGEDALNVRQGGHRLLIVGSISPHMRAGDVISGIGTKGPVPSRDEAPCRIFGLRGPMTYEKFKAAGHDLSEVGFLKDPGMLIKYMVERPERSPKAGRTLFIPHYRERELYRKRLPAGLTLCDIDDTPVRVAEQILDAEFVYSSSLHGVIFCHALGRPCRLISPQTEEPVFKYQDYYASVDLPFEQPARDLASALAGAKATSPAEVSVSREDFKFPALELLREAGVAD